MILMMFECSEVSTDPVAKTGDACVPSQVASLIARTFSGHLPIAGFYPAEYTFMPERLAQKNFADDHES